MACTGIGLVDGYKHGLSLSLALGEIGGKIFEAVLPGGRRRDNRSIDLHCLNCWEVLLEVDEEPLIILLLA